MRRLGQLDRRVLALVAGLAGCNAILDNEPGVLGSDVLPDTPAGPADAAPPDRGPPSQEGGAGAAPVSGSSPDAAAAEDACPPCDLAHATAACDGGACVIRACVAGFADCNADPADGCETDLSSIASCGGCGVVCPSAPHVTVACVDGACTGGCEPGWGDCNGKPKDGCEKNLQKDNRNCGECGARCVIGRCDEGSCVWP